MVADEEAAAAQAAASSAIDKVAAQLDAFISAQTNGSGQQAPSALA